MARWLTFPLRGLCAAVVAASVLLSVGPARAQQPPPHAPGYPPPPSHYPPAAAPTAAAPTAAATAADKPPDVIHDWDPDEPAPEGYRRVSSINGGMLAAGISMFGAFYLTTILVGVVGQEYESESSAIDDVKEDDWIPIYVPIVGPIIAIRTLDASATGAGFLIVDALYQTAGVVFTLVGALDDTTKLVRHNLGDNIEVVPFASPGHGGLGVTGRF